MTDAQRKQKRKVYGLRYRMKKKGYHFAGRANQCTMPDDNRSRSRLMERRAIALDFTIQYSLTPLFNEEMGGVANGLLSVVCFAVSLCKIVNINL